MSSAFYEEIRNADSPYIIAEIGANHNGELALGYKLIDAASECGCHAAKFQSWNKHSLFCKSFYEENSQFVDEQFGTLEEMVERFSLSKSDHQSLKAYCDKTGIDFCSSSFSNGEVQLLDGLTVPFIKIASMDLNNPYLLTCAAETGRPIMLSTGMGDLAEIESALNVITATGNDQIVLMHCVSLYPPEDAQVNLHNIGMLEATFGYPVGFSDHTVGTSIPLAAITVGAKVIEKHFTLDKGTAGWDHAVSADPNEMTVIVKEGKRIVAALGSYQRSVSETEREQRKAFRRSIVAARDLKKGDRISIGDLAFKRPGRGVAPDKTEFILDRKLNRDIAEDEIIMWEALD